MCFDARSDLRHVLSIAGSDPSAGAGIQADLKAMSACGVFGMTVITALTAQNTLGVQNVLEVDADFVGQQIDAIFEDIRVDTVKIGMLGSPSVVTLVAERLKKYQPEWVIIDPVMQSKNVYSLMESRTLEVFVSELLPLADLVTPNLQETAALTGIYPGNIDEMKTAGERLLALGPRAVLVKGGHQRAHADDVLVYKDGSRVFKGERLSNPHSHGTGCALSSAIAAFLARGLALDDAIGRAKDYVRLGIAHGFALGKGVGPIHHFYSLYKGMVLQL